MRGKIKDKSEIAKYVGTIILGVGAGIAGYFLGRIVCDSLGFPSAAIKYLVKFGMVGAFSVCGGFVGYNILERIING